MTNQPFRFRTFCRRNRSWTQSVFLLATALIAQPLSAATFTPAFDARSETDGAPAPLNTDTADLGVGPVATNRSFRSYLTFDLSALTGADTAVSVSLQLNNIGSEGNTTSLPQVFTLFQVSSNWDGVAAPGPEGTALATVDFTPVTGTDTKNLVFTNTAAFVAAFNGAIGGNLYLGVKTDKENYANRSFAFFASSEDAGIQPTLTSVLDLPTIAVSVPDNTMAEPGADTATFTITRSLVTNTEVTVYYSLSGTATEYSDYTQSGFGSVTLPANVNETNITLSVINDAEAERVETVILTITADAAYNSGGNSGTVTITDDNDDNNDVVARYIFTSGQSTFSLNAQVYSASVSATPIGLGAGIPSIGNAGVAVSPPNAGYIPASSTSSNETEALANDDYFSFTLTPALGSSLTLTNLEISARYYVQNTLGTDGTIFVRSSVDGFASNVASNSYNYLSGSTYSELSVPLGAAYTQVPSNVTFRVYLFDDTTDGTDGFRFDDIFVRGYADTLPGGVQQVNLSVTDTNAVEHPTTPDSGQFTISRYGDTSGSLTVYYTVGGTAINGVDYNLITNEVTMGSGVSNAVIFITPIDDFALEGDETVALALVQTNSYLVVAPTSGTVIISDDAEPSQVSVTANDGVAYERDSNLIGQFTLTRNDTNAAFSVNFAFGGGATFGVDYNTSATNSIDFAVGEASKTVTVFPINDNDVEGTETVILTLQTNGASDYILVANTNATTRIYDDELGTETVLFSDAFETTDSSTNYLQLDAARDGIPDSTVVYAYDYSVEGVPAAPGSATTLGLRLSANKNDATGQAAAVNLIPTNVVVSGDYALRFNAYITWNPTSNFGEHLLCGINQTGTKTNWQSRSAGVLLEGDGQYVTINNNELEDGGNVGGLVALNGSATSSNAPALLDGRARSSLATVLNNPPYGANGGLAGTMGCATTSTNKTWVDCELSQVGGVVTFKINNWPALTYTNTSDFTNGYAVIGYNDMFDSLSSLSNNFALVDNLRIVDLTSVTVPVITSIGVAGSTVTIDFTGGSSDTATDFTVVSAPVVTGTYTSNATQVITGPTGGPFQSTTVKSGSQEFFRIRRN